MVRNIFAALTEDEVTFEVQMCSKGVISNFSYLLGGEIKILGENNVGCAIYSQI